VRSNGLDIFFWLGVSRGSCELRVRRWVAASARTAKEEEEGAAEPVAEEAEAADDPLGLAELQDDHEQTKQDVPDLWTMRRGERNWLAVRECGGRRRPLCFPRVTAPPRAEFAPVRHAPLGWLSLG